MVVAIATPVLLLLLILAGLLVIVVVVRKKRHWRNSKTVLAKCVCSISSATQAVRRNRLVTVLQRDMLIPGE